MVLALERKVNIRTAKKPASDGRIQIKHPGTGKLEWMPEAEVLALEAKLDQALAAVLTDVEDGPPSVSPAPAAAEPDPQLARLRLEWTQAREAAHQAALTSPSHEHRQREAHRRSQFEHLLSLLDEAEQIPRERVFFGTQKYKTYTVTVPLYKSLKFVWYCADTDDPILIAAVRRNMRKVPGDKLRVVREGTLPRFNKNHEFLGWFTQEEAQDMIRSGALRPH